jgi:hypothetical protein
MSPQRSQSYLSFAIRQRRAFHARQKPRDPKAVAAPRLHILTLLSFN